MSQLRASSFKRTSATIATVDVDPNTLLPALPPGVDNGSGFKEGVPFVSPETWKNSASCALMLALAKTAGGNSTATVSIWFFDPGYQVNAGDGGCWVLLKSAQVITEGTPFVVPFLRGDNYQYYVQVTAQANTPKALLGYFIPQP